jgi:hypothetical protein
MFIIWTVLIRNAEEGDDDDGEKITAAPSHGTSVRLHWTKAVHSTKADVRV